LYQVNFEHSLDILINSRTSAVKLVITGKILERLTTIIHPRLAGPIFGDNLAEIC